METATIEIQIDETQAREQFRIDNDGKADWLLEQYAAIDSHIVLLEAQARDAVKRLKSERLRLENLFGAELEQYIAAKVAADKRGKKSVILPHGTCCFRTVPASLRVTEPDNAEAISYGCRNGIVETIEVLDTMAYRKLAEEMLEETGELLPGVELVPARESFSVKFGKSE